MVGRAGHSAKTKAHRGREIDVLIFPFVGQAAGYSESKEGTRRKNVVTFVPLQEAFFVRGERRTEIPSREGLRGSRAGGDGSGEAFV